MVSIGPSAATLRRHWLLEPGLAFLNHGSFGACPRPILERQQELREQLERQPVRFFVRELEALIDGARERLAAFVGADPEGLAPVPNATAGVNAVLRSLDLARGDELLTTDHAYGACRNALEHVAARAGARVVVAALPFPIASEDDVVEAVLGAATEKTRVALLDHVTSPTAIVLPIARLVAALRERGIETVVDGAHAPGMLDLDLEAIGAAWYTGNLHKWPCAPKGAAFLSVRADLRDSVWPTCISHGESSRRPGRTWLHDRFDWTGTADPTPFLCVPAALDFLAGLLPGGWEDLRQSNRALARRGRDLLCASLGVPPPAPDAMLGSMAAVPLPDGPCREPARWAMATDPLQDRLLHEHAIEVPVVPWPRQPHRLVRVGTHVYNDEAELARLASALPGLLADERA